MFGPRTAARLFLAIAFLGFLDASFLAIEHYRGAIPPCSILQGCEKVTTSEYSVVFGVPVALLGALYYLFILGMALWYLDRGNERALALAGGAAFLGLLASAWFVYIQLFVLRAICIYCMFSAASSLALGLVGLLRKRS